MALIISICFPVSTFAAGLEFNRSLTQQFKAWIAAAITAINIGLDPVQASTNTFLNDYLVDPLQVVYTYGEQDVDDWMDQSVIKIDKNVTSIDGKYYTDVWLSSEAAEKFRVNAFDFKTAYSIASNTSGTFADGYGYVDGLPLFDLGQTIESQHVYFTDPGDNEVHRYFMTNGWEWLLRRFQYAGPTYEWELRYGRNNVGWQDAAYICRASSNDTMPLIGWLQVGDSVGRVFVHGANSGTLENVSGMPIYAQEQPFQFDYAAGEIPAQEIFDGSESLRIRVPTDEIEEVINDYPSLTDPNGVTIDLDAPDIDDVIDKIDELMDIIIPLIPILDIDFVDYETPAPAPEREPIPDPDPYPDPAPAPGTTIMDTDWYDIFETIKHIFDQVSIGNSITSAIKSLLDRVKWGIDEIIEKIGDLPDAFERHIINTWRKALDVLKGLFAPILLLLKNAIGIWHHVVYWISYIAGPFWWLMNIITQGYPGIMYPIYASIAGFIVIAVYRRIGR